MSRIVEREFKHKPDNEVVTTSNIRHRIQIKYKKKLGEQEWLLVHQKLDELLDERDKERLSNLLDDSGTSPSPMFTEILQQLFAVMNAS